MSDLSFLMNGEIILLNLGLDILLTLFLDDPFVISEGTIVDYVVNQKIVFHPLLPNCFWSSNCRGIFMVAIFLVSVRVSILSSIRVSLF